MSFSAPARRASPDMEATVDLVAFLLARIEEDEGAAQAAMSYADNAGVWHALEYDYEGIGVSSGPLDRQGLMSVSVSEATALITRWPPGRVLAECEAKRRIIARCETAEREAGIAGEDAGPEVAEDVLRALAAPYSSHPDYQPGWALVPG